MNGVRNASRHAENCKLCGLRKPLCRSHILPDLAYTDVIDRHSHPRMVVVRAADPHRVADTTHQTGFWERLLCRDCEQKFSGYEDYSSRHLLDAPLPGANPLTGLIEFRVGSYARVKLFLLSLLWRVGVAKGDFFRCVDLGRHERLIREMLNTEKPGAPDDYGCLVTPLIPEPDVAMHRVILMPMMTRLNGTNGCLLVFRGFVFQYFISQHGIPPGVRRSFLNENGEMLMLRVPGAVFPPIRELWQLCIDRLRRDAGTAGPPK